MIHKNLSFFVIIIQFFTYYMLNTTIFVNTLNSLFYFLIIAYIWCQNYFMLIFNFLLFVSLIPSCKVLHVSFVNLLSYCTDEAIHGCLAKILPLIVNLPCEYKIIFHHDQPGDFNLLLYKWLGFNFIYTTDLKWHIIISSLFCG